MLRGACIAVTALALTFAQSDDAAACSCRGPSDVIVSPRSGSVEPQNAHIRVEVTWRQSTTPVPVVRANGVAVDTKARSWRDGAYRYFDLTPTAPLQANTHYEVALVEPDQFPSTRVLGAFVTTGEKDTTAPTLDAVGSAIADGNAHPGGGSCGIAGPWIEVGPIRASDPQRADAKLLYALWVPGANGKLDTTKSPDTLIEAREDKKVDLGKTSLCDPHDFTLGAKPPATIAIAAVDEAGNTSAPRTLKVTRKP